MKRKLGTIVILCVLAVGTPALAGHDQGKGRSADEASQRRGRGRRADRARNTDHAGRGHASREERRSQHAVQERTHPPAHRNQQYARQQRHHPRRVTVDRHTGYTAPVYPRGRPVYSAFPVKQPAFESVLHRMDDAQWTREKMRVVRQNAHHQYFTTWQVRQILDRLYSASDKRVALQILSGRIVDPHNVSIVVDAFFFQIDRRFARRLVFHARA